MPATITDTPLGIRCVFSDGSGAEFRVDGLPCPELVHDLLTGLVESIHPHGTVDAAGSVRFYVVALRDMVSTLAGWGFTGGAADLTRATLAQYGVSVRKLPGAAIGSISPGQRTATAALWHSRHRPVWQTISVVTSSNSRVCGS